MKKILTATLLACLALTGAGSAQSKWIGPGGADYNDDGDWSDATAWSGPVPGSDPGMTAVLEAMDFDGVNAEVDTRTVTLDMDVDLLALEAPLNIHWWSSAYRTNPTTVVWLTNKVRLEADMTIGTLVLGEQRFWLDQGPNADLVINGGSGFPRVNSDDATATVLFDGPSQVSYGSNHWPPGFYGFKGTLTVGSLANPCLLGGYYWISITEDPLDLIPDLPGGNSVVMGDASTVIIPDGSAVVGHWENEWGPQLDLGGKIVLGGDGVDVDGDFDDDGALVFHVEGYSASETALVGSAGTTTIEMTGDTEIGVKVSPNLVAQILGNVVGPAGAPGCTLTKSGVGQLRLDGDVGVDCANQVEMHVMGGKVVLNGDFYGDIYVHSGGTLVAAASKVLCGSIDTATYGGTWSQMGIWDGNNDLDGGDDVSWHDPLNWSDDAVPGATASIGAWPTPIEIDTVAFPAPALTTVDSLLATSAATIQVNAPFTLHHAQLDSESFTFQIAADQTLTIDNNDMSIVQGIVGPASSNVVKEGLGQLRCQGSNWEAFFGTLTVRDGIVGGKWPASGGDGFYLNSAGLVVEDGGSVVACTLGNELGDPVAISGGGDPDTPDWWHRNAGALHHFIQEGADTFTFSAPVTVGAGGGAISVMGEHMDVNLGALVADYTGTFSGTGPLTKQGLCLLKLSGAVNNAGGVIVEEGPLQITGMVAGDVTVKTPPAEAPEGWYEWFKPYNGQTSLQGGSGTIMGRLTMENGSLLSPRWLEPTEPAIHVRAPVHLTVGDADLGGCTYEVSIKAIGDSWPPLPGDITGAATSEGTAGTDWDLLTVTATGTNGSGVLEITATPQNPITIKVVSLDANDNPGPVEGFEIGWYYSWPIAQADAIIGFDPSAFVVGSSGFAPADGAFHVALANGDTELRLEYVPTYDPCWSYCWQLGGKINILDLIAVRNHLNEVVDSSNENYDLTGDGKINILDMIAVRNCLNTVCD